MVSVNVEINLRIDIWEDLVWFFSWNICMFCIENEFIKKIFNELLWYIEERNKIVMWRKFLYKVLIELL